MTANDLKVSARRLANDAEQLRGRQRSLVKLGGGVLKEKWKPEFDTLQIAIDAIDESCHLLNQQSAGEEGSSAEHLGMLNTSDR